MTKKRHKKTKNKKKKRNEKVMKLINVMGMAKEYCNGP